jgi:hypothetical protein
MSAFTHAPSEDDVCQRCTYSRWAHENAQGELPELCSNFEPYPGSDPLEREPDYDFAAFRRYCEANNVDVAHADVAFVMWLHTEAARAQQA